MSHLFAEPQMMAAAAADLSAIRSTVGAANAAAAVPTAGVLPAGGDTVSARIAAMFGMHAQAYQVIGAHATAFHDQFVQALQASAGSYVNAEAHNASPMQQALGMFKAASENSSGGSPGSKGAHAGHNGGGGAPPPGSAFVGASSPNGDGGGGGAAGVGAHPGNGVPAATGGPQGDGGGGAMPGGNGGSAVPGGGGDPSAGFSGGDGGVAHVGAAAGGGASAVADPGSWAGSYSGAAGAAGTHIPNTGWAAGAGSPGAAGLSHGGGGTGDSGVIGGMGVPAAASPAGESPAAVQPDLSLATKVQPVQSLIPVHPDNPTQPGNPARPGDLVDSDRDKALQFVPVPLPRLRGLRKKLQGLRLRGDREEGGLRKQPAEDRRSGPLTPEELLSALGLRPPGHE